MIEVSRNCYFQARCRLSAAGWCHREESRIRHGGRSCPVPRSVVAPHGARVRKRQSVKYRVQCILWNNCWIDDLERLASVWRRTVSNPGCTLVLSPLQSGCPVLALIAIPRNWLPDAEWNALSKSKALNDFNYDLCYGSTAMLVTTFSGCISGLQCRPKTTTKWLLYSTYSILSLRFIIISHFSFFFFIRKIGIRIIFGGNFIKLNKD